jgi:hypothetical protein
MKVGFLMLLLFLMISCSNKLSHKTQSFIINNSGLNLRLEYYRKGKLLSNYTLSIADKEKLLAFTDESVDKWDGESYIAYLQGQDSLIITYADNKKATYYSFNVTGNNNEAILFASKRNVLNLGNWQKDIVLETEKRLETNYTFTFTQEDYLKAK